jgi:hypothetical protein
MITIPASCEDLMRAQAVQCLDAAKHSVSAAALLVHGFSPDTEVLRHILKLIEVERRKVILDA